MYGHLFHPASQRHITHIYSIVFEFSDIVWEGRALREWPLVAMSTPRNRRPSRFARSPSNLRSVFRHRTEFELNPFVGDRIACNNPGRHVLGPSGVFPRSLTDKRGFGRTYLLVFARAVAHPNSKHCTLILRTETTSQSGRELISTGHHHGVRGRTCAVRAPDAPKLRIR